MDINKVRWSYGIIRATGPLDMTIHEGPLPDEKITEIVGGEFEFIELMDRTVIAVRKDRDVRELPLNPHYPGIRGDLVLGKFSDGIFVGVLGVAFGM